MRMFMLTSTLPRFSGDMQANFVGEQAEAWLGARGDDEIDVLAPDDLEAPGVEDHGRLRVTRFRYFWPAALQKLAYPAIMPNIKRDPLLILQLPFFLAAQYAAAARLIRERRIDLVYAHWLAPQGITAWYLYRRFGLPFVLQNHSSDLAIFGKLGAPGRWMARLLLENCTRFPVPTRPQSARPLRWARKTMSILPEGTRKTIYVLAEEELDRHDQFDAASGHGPGRPG